MFYYEFTTTDHSIGGPHIYYYRSRGSYIIVVLYLNIITLEYNKLPCLRTYIIVVIINCYPLDKNQCLRPAMLPMV